MLLKENKSEILKIISKKNTLQNEERGDTYIAPLTNQQRNIYFLESLSVEKNFYNVTTAFSIFGNLDRSSLKLAVASLCKNFHVLRTVYKYQENELKQLIQAFDLSKVPFDFFSVDDSIIEQRLNDEANYCFELENEWPIKASLFVSPKKQIFSLNIHHIAVDGYSIKLIVNALSEAYKFYRSTSGLEYNLNYAPQYADYAFWRQSYLNSSACQDARNYWTRLLKDPPTCHNFPLEFTRPSKLSVEGDIFCEKITGKLFSKIKQAAQSKNISIFLLMQSLFAGFMGRLGDEEDLIIGSVYANRTPSEFIETVGMFANTIPFRYSFNETTDISCLINSTRSQHKQAIIHQQFSFDMMLEGLNLKRDPSFNPLVQVQFVLQEDSINDFSLDGLDVEVIGNRQLVAKFDFAVHIFISDECLKMQWEFNTNLFSEDRIIEVSEYFLSFIKFHIDNESSKVLLFNFDADVIKKEKSKVQFNRYSSNPELIELYAISTPNAIAVTDSYRKVSYQEFIERANSLIAGLQHQGVSFGDKVAVYMDKSIEQVITMFAVMRAGFVYIPLDPSYPEERLAYMCKNAGVLVILHNEDLPPPKNIAENILHLTYTNLIISERVPVLSKLKQDHPAYILYTSGSTGMPKGVLVSHGSIFYSLDSNRKVYGFESKDIIPTIGSLAFGVSLLEIFLPLLSGATVELLKNSEVIDLTNLIASTQHVTVMHMVPSLMSQWLDKVESCHELYPSLRLLLVGAEPVPLVLLERLKVWRPEIAVRVLYGMTESSVVCSSFLSNAHNSYGYGIGTPHPNVMFFITNRLGVPQPTGVAGELYVGGLSLASGYINMPALTSERFVQNKLLNERVYKTGDRAKKMPSGYFEFLGRIDNQVSLRGMRIEVGEIESLVNKMDEIKQSVAHIVLLDNGEKIFSLYYTKSSDYSEIDIKNSIKDVLTKYIPESMRPSILIELSNFPLNSNGKIDREKLPKPIINSDYVPPVTDVEKYLHTLWCEMLGLDCVSILDSLFVLGGHSLIATKIINEINEKYRVSIPINRFLESPNIKLCADLVQDELDNLALSKSLINMKDVGPDNEVDEFIF